MIFPATTAGVADAARAAEHAFTTFAALTHKTRATLLQKIADNIEARESTLTETGTAETGLPAARLDGERARTTGQLRLFADFIEAEHHMEFTHVEADQDRTPLPRPDLRRVMRPIGPVAVFGASNFPLAFSTAGGDTASALAAGCPTIVKGHPGHPKTGRLVAEAVIAALQDVGLPTGTLDYIDDTGGPDSHAVGQAIVADPVIRAVGFTGSLRGGRALYDVAAARPDPIPFFGELGSVNPVFVMPNAATARGSTIASGWVASLTLGAGQFCTNPGIIFVPAKGMQTFSDVAVAAVNNSPPQVMLSDGIAASYASGVAGMTGLAGVTILAHGAIEGRSVRPTLLATEAQDLINNPELFEEVFGPMGLIVAYRDLDQLEHLARSLPGQLTCTIQMDDTDAPHVAPMMPQIERRSGRVLFNGFPTGVEVSTAMVHGGPWPASTDPRFTSVGTLAIRRWLRPVCYQDAPAAVLDALAS